MISNLNCATSKVEMRIEPYLERALARWMEVQSLSLALVIMANQLRPYFGLQARSTALINQVALAILRCVHPLLRPARRRLVARTCAGIMTN